MNQIKNVKDNKFVFNNNTDHDKNKKVNVEEVIKNIDLNDDNKNVNDKIEKKEIKELNLN
jgi:hypothetical protein